jgi:hypothetical protein
VKNVDDYKLSNVSRFNEVLSDIDSLLGKIEDYEIRLELMRIYNKVYELDIKK